MTRRSLVENRYGFAGATLPRSYQSDHVLTHLAPADSYIPQPWPSTEVSAQSALL